jgi:hypothetical protein
MSTTEVSHQVEWFRIMGDSAPDQTFIAYGSVEEAESNFLLNMERNEATRDWASARMLVVLESVWAMGFSIETKLIELESIREMDRDRLANQIEPMIAWYQDQASRIRFIIGGT